MELLHSGGTGTILLVKTYCNIQQSVELIAKRHGISSGDLRISFDGEKVSRFDSFSKIGSKDGDTFYLIQSQSGAKPVILLYPNSPIVCDVSIELCKKWELTSIYPTSKNEENTKFRVEWNDIKADQDGKLTIKDKEYPYLFWESDTIETLFQFDFNETFCVKSEIVGEFLDEILLLKGLNFKERCDFITFWLHQLQSKEFVMIQFLSFEFYPQIAKLKIKCSIQPETIIREFFIFSSCDEMNFECKGKLLDTRRERIGFTVVEWGALNMK